MRTLNSTEENEIICKILGKRMETTTTVVRETHTKKKIKIRKDKRFPLFKII